MALSKEANNELNNLLGLSKFFPCNSILKLE